MKNTLTTTQLLQKMENIVKRTLKGYKTDFYNIDTKTIKEIETSRQKESIIWIVRELGTHIVYLTGSEQDISWNKNYYHAIRNNWQKLKQYSITFDGKFWIIKYKKPEEITC